MLHPSRPLPLAANTQGIAVFTPPALGVAGAFSAKPFDAATVAAARLSCPVKEPTDPNCTLANESRLKLQDQAQVDGSVAPAAATTAPAAAQKPNAPPSQPAKPSDAKARSSAAVRNARWRLKKSSEEAKLKQIYLSKLKALDLPTVNLERSRPSRKGLARPSYDPPPEVKARMTPQELVEWRAVQRRKRKSEMQKRNRDEKRAMMSAIKESLPELVQKAEEREVAVLLLGLDSERKVAAGSPSAGSLSGDGKDGGVAAVMGGGGGQEVQEKTSLVHVKSEVGGPFASGASRETHVPWSPNKRVPPSSNVGEGSTVHGFGAVVSSLGCNPKMTSGRVDEDPQASVMLRDSGTGGVGTGVKIAPTLSRFKVSTMREQIAASKLFPAKKAAKTPVKKRGSQVQKPKATKKSVCTKSKVSGVGKNIVLDNKSKVTNSARNHEIAAGPSSNNNGTDKPHSPRSIVESKPTSPPNLPFAKQNLRSLDDYSRGFGNRSVPDSLTRKCHIDCDALTRKLLDSPRQLHCHTTNQTSKGYLIPYYGSLDD